MKHPLAKLAVTGMLLIASLSSWSQSADEEAIKQVCRAETDAYFRRDFAAWKATWLNDDKMTRSLIAPNFMLAFTGTQRSDSMARADMAGSPELFPTSFKDDNYIIRINCNMAWVEYDQTVTVPNTNRQERSREYRLLVKDKGQWKLANQVTVAAQSLTANDPEAIENDLNGTGYKLLTAKRIDEAIEVFKLNVKLHPNAWNTYDSLGEAYALAGNKELAIQHYEKSLELNPNNNGGKQALAKLRQQ